MACITSSSSNPARVVATSGSVLKTARRALSWTARKWLSQIFPTAAWSAWPRSGIEMTLSFCGEIGVAGRADQQPAGLRAAFAILGGRSEPLFGGVATTQRRIVLPGGLADAVVTAPHSHRTRRSVSSPVAPKSSSQRLREQ